MKFSSLLAQTYQEGNNRKLLIKRKWNALLKKVQTKILSVYRDLSKYKTYDKTKSETIDSWKNTSPNLSRIDKRDSGEKLVSGIGPIKPLLTN